MAMDEKAKKSKNQFYTIECTEDLIQQTVQFNNFLLNQCGTLKHIIEDISIVDESTPIPVPCSKELGALIVEYARVHEDCDPFATMESSKAKHENNAGEKTIVFPFWENNFLNAHFIAKNEKDQYQKDSLTFQLMKVANFLEYYELLHFAAKRIASIIRETATEDEIRKRFRVRNVGDPSDVSTEQTETPPNDADDDVPSVSNRKRTVENRDVPLDTQTQSKESLAKEKRTDEELQDVEREPCEVYDRCVKSITRMNHDEMYAHSMQWTYYDEELSENKDD